MKKTWNSSKTALKTIRTWVISAILSPAKGNRNNEQMNRFDIGTTGFQKQIVIPNVQGGEFNWI